MNDRTNTIQTIARTIATRRMRRIARVLPALVLLFLAACDTPTGFSDEATPMLEAPASFSVQSGSMDDLVVVQNDGTVRTLSAEDADVTVAEADEHRIAAIITGSATYANHAISQLRMNVRQTESGEISGQGTVTIEGMTTDFTPACVKSTTAWGRTFYGVTMALDQPVVRYGNEYGYVAVSLAEEGNLVPFLVYNTRSFCSASGYYTLVENRRSGNINVVIPRQ